ncbi:hypothetical protein SNE40_011852 [Patella caerulea]|uniref:Dolichyl-diphosphooligosaccharide--protein glycosyltransferase subunit KCP2 n=1 Tax=Patella caerulea TaxID=87958 RepID=A0AAN8PPV7_PATCE
MLQKESKMAVSSSMSLALSGTLTVVLFAGMQMFRQQLASVEYLTVVGGLLGSFLFILLLTAVGNFETLTFGKGFQAQIFPEVIMCLLVALFASGLIHRVCVTTCFIFSLVALYYINHISQKKYGGTTTPTTPVAPSKKKR